MPYQRPAPRSQHERAVQRAGYPWTSTVNLRPLGLGNRARPDVLNLHSHQSPNTHLIVAGRLTIHTASGESFTIDADNPSAQKEITVPAYMEYRGEAGPRGCTFIEGHSVLSPTTAQRFEDRHHLTWYEDGSGLSRGEWCDQHRQEREYEGVHVRPIRGHFSGN